MKSFHIKLAVGALLFCLSCKKDLIEKEPFSATVNLVNAISSYDAEIKMNFTGRNFMYADSKGLGYYNYDGKYSNGALTYAIPSNKDVPLVLTLSSDTTKPFFNQAVNIAEGQSYSLFTTGYPDAPGALLIKDSLINRPDSTGIRVINLSPNSDKINVNIYWGDFFYQFKDLEYKAITPFNAFAANITDPYYMVEVRNAVTDELYSEFFLDEVTRQKNITLIVRGLVYGDPFLEVVRMNH